MKTINQDGSMTNSRIGPVVVIDNQELQFRDNVEVARIEVRNENGKLARFWVSVIIKRGRPKLVISTKVGQAGGHRKQTTKVVALLTKDSFPLQRFPSKARRAPR